MSRQATSRAYRLIKSPNIKTRKRALKQIKAAKAKQRAKAN